jgi:hypothetical protein
MLKLSFRTPTSDVIVMTEPTFPTNPNEVALSRRGLLRIGGLSIGFAALIAACAEDSTDAKPARVGDAAPASKLPTVEVNDGVLWRTAASLHYSIIDAHNAAKKHGKLSAAQTSIVDAYIAANQDAISTIDKLTVDAGGEVFGCANPRFDRVVLGPLVDRMTGRDKTGNEESNVLPTDDAPRDALALAYTMETVAAATHQSLVALLSTPALRAEAMDLGQKAARRAAALALAIDPANRINPALVANANVTPSTNPDSARQRYFAVPSQFGLLAATQLAIGAVSEADTQFTMNIETPAVNSFVYDGQTC